MDIIFHFNFTAKSLPLGFQQRADCQERLRTCYFLVFFIWEVAVRRVEKERENKRVWVLKSDLRTLISLHTSLTWLKLSEIDSTAVAVIKQFNKPPSKFSLLSDICLYGITIHLQWNKDLNKGAAGRVWYCSCLSRSKYASRAWPTFHHVGVRLLADTVGLQNDISLPNLSLYLLKIHETTVWIQLKSSF